MKHIIAIFFLLSYMSVNTAFAEVWKLPSLIDHYMLHVEIEGEVSIVQFLKEHYTEPSHHHGNSKEHHHEKLPFKTLDEATASTFVIVPQAKVFELFKIPVFIEKKFSLYKKPSYANDYNGHIWQPPRFC